MIIINDSLTRADAATQYKLLSTLIAQKHQMTLYNLNFQIMKSVLYKLDKQHDPHEDNS